MSSQSSCQFQPQHQPSLEALENDAICLAFSDSELNFNLNILCEYTRALLQLTQKGLYEQDEYKIVKTPFIENDTEYFFYTLTNTKDGTIHYYYQEVIVILKFLSLYFEEPELFELFKL